MNIQKHIVKDLTKVAEDPEKQRYAEYVMLVLGGSKKTEALKEVFPERYQRALERSSGNARVVAANAVKEVRLVERTKVVKELYEQSHKTWWIEFLEKKHTLYENLYSMALDEDINARERVAASKVMLEHMPSFQEDINVKVEVKQTKADFVAQLRDMQKSLHKTANSEPEEEPITIEVEDYESK